MVKEVGPLLKSYQEEIDRLTGRAKLGESAFLDVYQRLYEAPDPAAALMAGLVRRSCDAVPDPAATLTLCLLRAHHDAVPDPAAALMAGLVRRSCDTERPLEQGVPS